ncbi:alpha/beta hydrolase [Leuconostoc mesenteroides]
MINRKFIITIVIFLSIVGVILMIINQQNVTKNNKTKEERHDSRDTDLLRYQTTYRGKTYQKSAPVYLPKDYRSSDKKYNVLILMHGWSMTSRDFISGRTDDRAPIIADLMKKEKEPFIVVTPTYYPNRSFVTDSWDDDRPLNERFSKVEVTEVLDAVKTKYRVYDSRNHYAFAGFSMGSITTWDVLENQLDKFRYFQMMASGYDGDIVELRQQLQRSELPLDITISAGSDDSTIYGARNSAKSLQEISNVRLFTDQGGEHNLSSAMRQLDYGMKFFFK